MISYGSISGFICGVLHFNIPYKFNTKFCRFSNSFNSQRKYRRVLQSYLVVIFSESKQFSDINNDVPINVKSQFRFLKYDYKKIFSFSRIIFQGNVSAEFEKFICAFINLFLIHYFSLLKPVKNTLKHQTISNHNMTDLHSTVISILRWSAFYGDQRWSTFTAKNTVISPDFLV